MVHLGETRGGYLAPFLTEEIGSHTKVTCPLREDTCFLGSCDLVPERLIGTFLQAFGVASYRHTCLVLKSSGT